MLQGASSAIAPVRAWRRGSRRTRPDDFLEFADQVLPLFLDDAEADGVSGGCLGDEYGSAIQAGDARPARGDALHPLFMDGPALMERKGVHGNRALMAYISRK